MSALESLLKEIKEGATLFRPASSNETDMWDFQPIAKMLEYAFNESYLESFECHKESCSGHGWYDLVIVKGGLSHKGEMFLAKPNAEAEKKMEEIIMVKPNIHGIGIDLRALWRRWKDRNK